MSRDRHQNPFHPVRIIPFQMAARCSTLFGLSPYHNYLISSISRWDCELALVIIPDDIFLLLVNTANPQTIAHPPHDIAASKTTILIIDNGKRFVATNSVAPRQLGFSI